MLCQTSKAQSINISLLFLSFNFNFLDENGKQVLMLCRTYGFRSGTDSQKENMSDNRTHTGSLVPFALP